MVYSIFGTNFFIGTQIRAQLEMLKEKVPQEFQHCNMDDLGCGDGKITLLLKEVFLPRKLRAFDVNSFLVNRARRRGIEAQVKNLSTGLPNGDLAVMWGVLHHLKDKETCLKRIRENYSMAFIREPVKNKAIKGLEMGQPLIKAEIENLINKYFPEAEYFYYKHCIFMFFISPHLKIK